MESGPSATFADAITGAINEVLANEGGGIVTAIAGAASIMDSDGDNALVVFAPDTQPIVTTMGLIDFVGEHARTTARAMIYGQDSGDDD